MTEKIPWTKENRRIEMLSALNRGFIEFPELRKEVFYWNEKLGCAWTKEADSECEWCKFNRNEFLRGVRLYHEACANPGKFPELLKEWQEQEREGMKKYCYEWDAKNSRRTEWRDFLFRKIIGAGKS